MASSPRYVLVTGATGFIGAHVVDQLLGRGIKVRGATRSKAKGDAMIAARPQHAGLLDFVQIDDFETKGDFAAAVQDIDGVIHIASPFTYNTTDNEKELIIPAINGVQSVLEAAAATSTVRRVVITSSFASIIDDTRQAPPYFTYKADDWNPLTYAEAIDAATTAVIAYRGSKKFAEKAAWDFVEERKPAFDIATICPPMTFGPIVHPVASVDALNESNAMLWRVARGDQPLPVARVPFWVDVRDLAVAHVEALLHPGTGSKRYIVAAPDRFTYGLAAKIIGENFPWAGSKVSKEVQTPNESHGLDGVTAAKELGFTYRTFEQSVIDLVKQAEKMEGASSVVN